MTAIRIWFWLRCLGQWVKAVLFWILKIASVLVLLYCVYRVISLPLTPNGAAKGKETSYLWTPVLGAALLLLIAYHREIWELIRSRDIEVGPERIGLTKTVAPSEPFEGSVRDNFIYLGIVNLRGGEYRLAYEHFAAAHRLKKSILAAFRCMQCLAFMAAQEEERDTQGTAFDDQILRLYGDALWAARWGPGSDVVGRERFAAWILDHQAGRWDQRFIHGLKKDLQRLDF